MVRGSRVTLVLPLRAPVAESSGEASSTGSGYSASSGFRQNARFQTLATASRVSRLVSTPPATRA